jgi:hypothetical protein
VLHVYSDRLGQMQLYLLHATGVSIYLNIGWLRGISLQCMEEMLIHILRQPTVDSPVYHVSIS